MFRAFQLLSTIVPPGLVPGLVGMLLGAFVIVWLRERRGTLGRNKRATGGRCARSWTAGGMLRHAATRQRKGYARVDVVDASDLDDNGNDDDESDGLAVEEKKRSKVGRRATSGSKVASASHGASQRASRRQQQSQEAHEDQLDSDHEQQYFDAGQSSMGKSSAARATASAPLHPAERKTARAKEKGPTADDVTCKYNPAPVMADARCRAIPSCAPTVAVQARPSRRPQGGLLFGGPGRGRSVLQAGGDGDGDKT